MKKFFVLLIAVGASFASFAQDNEQYSDELIELAPAPEHAKALFVTLNLLEQYHYRKIDFNDSLSSVVYDNYINSLDPSKAFFLKADLDYFEKYRYELDDELKSNRLEFGFQLFTLYRDRVLERYDYIPTILETEFDFTKDEYYNTDFEGDEWVTTREELNEKWRLLMKTRALSLVMAEKEWEDVKEILDGRNDRRIKALRQNNSEDVFQAYLNALTSAYDPHTDYFSPITSENFQINMSLSLEGIGARLGQQLDYTQVASIVPGGPAFKSKRLFKDDKIIAVAQGDDGEFVDVIGWRLDDVVQQIRGPKGSVVRLMVLGKGDINATPDTVRIVREKIKLEDEAAKAEMIPITEGNETYNIGVITIPSFYIDFEERSKGVQDYKSTTRDVKKLIDDLKAQNVDGLLIDLRYNGGGSLQEAIDLTGLFISRGPVVQVRNVDNSVEALYDEDGSTVYYDGPLAVLGNRYSASASEIFAGAIQDYKRGVILGENSFGKGTVQSLISLDRPVINYLNRLIAMNGKTGSAADLEAMRTAILAGDLRMGQIKMTLAKFYRATGSSTQKLGVQPDIMFPSYFDADEVGESSSPNALPWDEIAAQPFDPTNDVPEELIDKLYQVYLQHLSTDPQLIDLVEEINKQKADRENTQISLNLEQRKSEVAEVEADDDLTTKLGGTEVFFVEENREKMATDPYLKESIRLLAEMAKTQEN